MNEQVNAEADALFQQFSSTMSSLEQTNNRRVIDLWLEDLQEIQTKAHELLSNQFIHPIQLNRMKIICQRSPDEWRVLAKSSQWLKHQFI